MSFSQGRIPKGYKGMYTPPKLPKVDLTTDAEYAANLVNVITTCNCPAVQFITWVYYTCIMTFLVLPRRICNRHCLFVCLSDFLLATLRKSFQTDLQTIFWEGWQWVNEQII